MNTHKLKHLLNKILKEQDKPLPGLDNITPMEPLIQPSTGTDIPSLDIKGEKPKEDPSPKCFDVTATLCNTDNSYQSTITQNFNCITVDGQTPQIGSYFEADKENILNPDTLFYVEAESPLGFNETEVTAVPGCMYNSEYGYCDYFPILYLGCGVVGGDNNLNPCTPDGYGGGSTFYNPSTGEFSAVGDTSVEDFGPMGLEQAYQDTQGSLGPYGGYSGPGNWLWNPTAVNADGMGMVMQNLPLPNMSFPNDGQSCNQCNTWCAESNPVLPGDQDQVAACGANPLLPWQQEQLDVDNPQQQAMIDQQIQAISNSWVNLTMSNQVTMTFYTLVHEDDPYIEYAGVDLNNEPTISEYNELSDGEVLGWGFEDAAGDGSNDSIPVTQESLDYWTSLGYYVVEVDYSGNPEGADAYMSQFNPSNPDTWYNENYWSPEPGVNDGFGNFSTASGFGGGSGAFGLWGPDAFNFGIDSLIGYTNLGAGINWIPGTNPQSYQFYNSVPGSGFWNTWDPDNIDENLKFKKPLITEGPEGCIEVGELGCRNAECCDAGIGGNCCCTGYLSQGHEINDYNKDNYINGVCHPACCNTEFQFDDIKGAWKVTTITDSTFFINGPQHTDYPSTECKKVIGRGGKTLSEERERQQSNSYFTEQLKIRAGIIK